MEAQPATYLGIALVQLLKGGQHTVGIVGIVGDDGFLTDGLRLIHLHQLIIQLSVHTGLDNHVIGQSLLLL